MDERKLKAKIQRQWDIPGLITDLRQEKWRRTEPNRIDRMHWVGSYQTIEQMAREASSTKEWSEAAKEGFESEIVDEYMEVLAEVVSDGMGKELRREHVYATFEDGEAWIGQYEDMAAEELRAMGFEIEA
jgi:hypothetical protein